MLTRLRAGRVQLHGLLELGDRVPFGIRQLDRERPGVIVLSGTGEPDLAADLEQLVAVRLLTRVSRRRDRLTGGVRVAETGRRYAVEEVRRRAVRPGRT